MSSSFKTKFIRVGHSPDPDDAFMFYALAKNKIPLRGFQVEHVIEDIETLNQRAMQAGTYAKVPPLEVTAISCHAYAYLADRYAVMCSGASVGDHYGPVLVARTNRAACGTEKSAPAVVKWAEGRRTQDAIRGQKVAVPGKYTTAFLVLQIFQPDFKPVFIPFDRIFEAVRSGVADFGLVIHEGQLTFQKEGFEQAADLGQWWHDTTGLPLPLGVDVIRRDLGPETIREFAVLFKESIAYALQNRREALAYALQYGRGIHADLGDRFVEMYVNDYTLDLGPAGTAGFEKLLELGHARGIIPRKIKPEFV